MPDDSFKSFILLSICAITLLAATGCVYRGDRGDRPNWGHADERHYWEHHHTDHGAGHDGDRDDHR